MCPRSCNAGWRKHPTPTDILVRRGSMPCSALRHGSRILYTISNNARIAGRLLQRGQQGPRIVENAGGGFRRTVPGPHPGSRMAGAEGRQTLLSATTKPSRRPALPCLSSTTEDSGTPREIRASSCPIAKLEDLVNGVTYLTTRDDVDPSRIGVFGSGGTGGGNAVMLAAQDPRVRCAVVQVPVADGEDWLRGMRGETSGTSSSPGSTTIA